jgi:hypothetical protein
MSDTPKPRTACLQDFFDGNITTANKYIAPSQNDTIIAKNQQEFGNRKRIKP